jgi:hypothetical protein
MAVSSSSPGCRAAIEGARRSLPGRWPEGDIDAQVAGAEACNASSGSTRVDFT